MEKCKICSSEVKSVFSARLLNKYTEEYFKCNKCGFIQLYNPYWLNEAYESAITNTDIGLLSRNLFLTNIASAIIKVLFKSQQSFLDYAGGYGVFVRNMRDRGYDFYRKDPYCENIFAKSFDYEGEKGDFELVTAFEVFEHLDQPLEEIDKIMNLGKSLLFSTELVPDKNKLESANDWWYIMPETGQHIAFYTYSSLEEIAKRYSCNLYSNRTNIHLLTPRKISPIVFKALTNRYITNFGSFLFTSRSLLMDDYYKLKQATNITK
jgi:hypothetical protein